MNTVVFWLVVATAYIWSWRRLHVSLERRRALDRLGGRLYNIEGPYRKERS